MLSLDTQHDILDLVIITFTGILPCYPVLYTVTCYSCMELSATQSKVPHHMRGGGHLLNLWGPPIESIPSEQSATWNKVPHHTRWGPPLESVGATS